MSPLAVWQSIGRRKTVSTGDVAPVNHLSSRESIGVSLGWFGHVSPRPLRRARVLNGPGFSLSVSRYGRPVRVPR